MKPLAILVVAEGIDEKIIERFKSCIYESKPKVNYDIVIERGNPDRKVFNKCIHLNTNLARLVHEYEVIIQTDIDLIIPPKLVDKTYNDAMTYQNSMIHSCLRYIDPCEIEELEYNDFPWKKWREVKPILCSGCWNGMTNRAWKRSGGYNEYMVEWGNEDGAFLKVCGQRGINIRKFSNLPLIHINHKQRTKKMSKHNIKMEKHNNINFLGNRISEYRNNLKEKYSE